jgi:two-component system NtrC family sensor kinase
MSLKKKIALSFFISAFIIAILAAFEYVNFTELKKEVRYLEVTDTINRKSLQLRRHEKNFFLYSPQRGNEESASVHAYLGELKTLLMQNPDIDKADKLALRSSIAEYERRFNAIEASSRVLAGIFEKTRSSHGKNEKFLVLVEATFLERPVQSAEFLEKVFSLPSGHALVTGLRALDADITALRKTGEDIMVISKDLDKVARENAETVIRISQMAILVFFPMFFIVGIGMLFFISTNVVRRLMLLISVVEKTGKGSYPHLPVSLQERNAHDEVGVLIEKFNHMEDQLASREEEIEQKNRELMQTKKLAAIGTLASGVAHEINNPLNNIYLSAQVLAREVGEGCSRDVKEAVGDIVGQTERVKRIVGDLLEFARGREPQFREVELKGLITDSYRRLGSSRNLEKIRFSLDADSSQTVVHADQGQMEQVFANLLANAVDAMGGVGDLRVAIRSSAQSVAITVSDSGGGIPRESIEKIFEPFFTTKDKGTGLGLAIVYNIIKKHSGDITVGSEEGRGTTFTVTLPTGREAPGPGPAGGGVD